MNDAGIQLACDVGGTSIKLGLVAGGSILARGEIPAQAEQGWRAALPRIVVQSEALARAANVTWSEVGGFALAFPGIIEPGTERILSTPAGKFDDAPDRDIPAEMERTLGRSAFIVNDANAALAGEWQFGAARDYDNVVMLTLGTGIGSSVIIEGVPLRGSHGQAGCLGGHMTTNVGGVVCRCGNLGCAETEASTWVLPTRARAHPNFAASTLASEAVLDYRAVFTHAVHGNRVARELRDEALRIWASVAVTLIHAYDPERLVIGGGILESGSVTLDTIRAYVERYAWTPWGRVEVVPAGLGNDAGMLGAAWLARQKVLAAKPK